MPTKTAKPKTLFGVPLMRIFWLFIYSVVLCLLVGVGVWYFSINVAKDTLQPNKKILNLTQVPTTEISPPGYPSNNIDEDSPQRANVLNRGVLYKSPLGYTVLLPSNYSLAENYPSIIRGNCGDLFSDKAGGLISIVIGPSNRLSAEEYYIQVLNGLNADYVAYILSSISGFFEHKNWEESGLGTFYVLIDGATSLSIFTEGSYKSTALNQMVRTLKVSDLSGAYCSNLVEGE